MGVANDIRAVGVQCRRNDIASFVEIGITKILASKASRSERSVEKADAMHS
jgi:hypothetical protein